MKFIDTIIQKSEKLIPFIFGLYFGLFLSLLSYEKIFGHNHIINDSSSIFFISLGSFFAIIILLINGNEREKKMFSFMITIGIIAGIVSILFPFVAIILAIMHGMVIGYLFFKTVLSAQPWRNLNLTYMGLAISFILSQILPVEYTPISIIIFILLSLLIWMVAMRSSLPVIPKISEVNWKKNWPIILLVSLLITVEVQWIFWHFVMEDLSPENNTALKYLGVLLLVILVRHTMYYVPKRWTSLGVLFSLALLTTLGLGMLYTWDYYFIFILVFGVSCALLLPKLLSHFDFQWSRSVIYTVLVFVIFSLFVSNIWGINHVYFVERMGMTQEWINTSFLQAWTKELASLTGLCVVILGVIYLKRK